jgi:hypothetical protein
MSSASPTLIIQMQDGSRLELKRDEQDRLVVTAWGPCSSDVSDLLLDGMAVVGFGPWHGWSANVTNRVETLPDEDSGLFEPERLFVLREQYVFLAPLGSREKPFSKGPIHKAWWLGTEHIVQARQVSTRH